MGLIASALAGGDSIDDGEVLRWGRSQAAIGGWMSAPPTLDTFMRSFSGPTPAAWTRCHPRLWGEFGC